MTKIKQLINTQDNVGIQFDVVFYHHADGSLQKKRIS
jgi:hypothetical protein